MEEAEIEEGELLESDPEDSSFKRPRGRYLYELLEHFKQKPASRILATEALEQRTAQARSSPLPTRFPLCRPTPPVLASKCYSAPSAHRNLEHRLV